MNNLLSSIQQSFQPNTAQSSILKQQQINQQKINSLLQQSAEALMCGPTCQKEKIKEELKQKYLDAETNLQIAPQKFEQTKKNFYVFTEGRPYYDNMQEAELKEKAEKIGELLTENFLEEVSSAKTMNAYYNTALINSGYTSQLFDELIKKNEELEKDLKNQHGDILTNDRKTYYETGALDSLKSWYKLWWYLYYILVLVVLLSMLFVQSKYSFLIKSILFVLLLFYPYYINYIMQMIHSLYTNVYNSIPKNVYNNL
jgi:hypothetical protein